MLAGDDTYFLFLSAVVVLDSVEGVVDVLAVSVSVFWDELSLSSFRLPRIAVEDFERWSVT